MCEDQQEVLVRPPTSHEEIGAYFLKGKNALFANPPHPQVFTLKNHAHCSPSDCLADFLAHSTKPISISNEMHHVELLLNLHKGKPSLEKATRQNSIAVVTSLWMDG